MDLAVAVEETRLPKRPTTLAKEEDHETCNNSKAGNVNASDRHMPDAGTELTKRVAALAEKAPRVPRCDTPEQPGYQELFIVEGDSASDAIRAVCDHDTQHVHAIQGKPMNVFRASEKAMRANDRVNSLFHRVMRTPVGSEADYVTFDRVILLTDANADGVHAKALLLGIFAEAMPDVIADGRLFTIRSPQFSVSYAQSKKPVFAYSSEGRESVISQLADADATNIESNHFSGLASMSSHELVSAFTNPETRLLSALDDTHVKSARSVFS